MKKLIATVLILLIGTAHAAINPSVVLTVGQWILKNSNRVYYVQVEGRGATEAEARHNGFVLAAEQAVGTVIVSERESTQRELIRNDIITYSSGYVEDFKVLNKATARREVVLKMDVWIAHSAIASRLLNVSRTEGTVEGGRISAQLQTIQHERTSADRLLKSVLNDYPARAFKVELEKTQASMRSDRTAQLEVAFYLSWDKAYLDSVSEVVTAINQRSDCGGVFGCRDVASTISLNTSSFGNNVRAWFNDNVAEQMFRKEMIQSNPAIQLTILDTTGRTQFQQCFYAKELDHRDYAPWYFVNVANNSVSINGRATKRFNTFVDLSKLPVDNLDQVKLSVIRGANC